tara:strand:- start:320 stop:679 length:360 start_codon:yes stop_codon:yes gene_type:complete
MGRSSNSFKGWVSGGDDCLYSGPDSETKLFTAVLSQAVHDVFSTHVEKIDKAQAMDFLTEDTRHLRMICELAGRDANYVREKIRKKLLSDENWNVDGCRKEYRNTHKGKKRGPKFKSED